MSTPFKMKGHTLPGPDQASPAKQTEVEGKKKVEKKPKDIKAKNVEDKKLPSFHKGDVSISQYTKSGEKRYNIVEE